MAIADPKEMEILLSTNLDTFEEYLEFFLEFIRDYKEGKFVNVKVVSTTTGNPTLPYQKWNKYIERHVEGTACSLKFTTKEEEQIESPVTKDDSPEIPVKKNPLML